ncbi:hypothetical protein KCP71_07170 [Salmonella enterica subsp. enterica]|nr:hypothetical protein KCP71_07170 [Salmonella enterica subsp. enterica]
MPFSEVYTGLEKPVRLMPAEHLYQRRGHEILQVQKYFLTHHAYSPHAAITSPGRFARSSEGTASSAKEAVTISANRREDQRKVPSMAWRRS